MRFGSFLLLAALLSAPAAGPAQDCRDYAALAPHWTGRSDVAIDAARLTILGAVAWSVGADGLSAFDLADPDQPRLLGTTPLPDAGLDLAVADGRACVTVAAAGLAVFDLTDPAAPVLLGTIPTPAPAQRVALVGTTAFVSTYADGQTRLLRVTTADPAAATIQQLDNLPTTYARPNALAQAYGLLFWGSSVFDVADPSRPRRLHDGIFGSSWLDLAVQGSLLLAADGDDGLVLRSLLNPLAPVTVGTFPTLSAATAVGGDPGRAWVGTTAHGVAFLDIADPAAPDLAHLVYAGWTVGDLAASPERLLIAAGPDGLQVIDPVPGPATDLTGTAAVPGLVSELAVHGDFVYLAAGSQGLQIVAAADPTAPLLLGSVATGTATYGIHVVGDLACAVDENTGLTTLDLGLPAAPVVLGNLPLPGRPREVVIAGPTAWVTDFDGALYGVDLGDPAAPALLSTLPLPGSGVGLAAADGFLYAVCLEAGLQVIDVTDPAAPLAGDLLAVGNSLRDVALVDGRALLAAYGSGLVVADLADPAHPVITGSLATIGLAISVCGVGETAFVGSYDPYLQAIDLVAPDAPRTIGLIALPERAWDSNLESGRLLLAAGFSGLLIAPAPCAAAWAPAPLLSALDEPGTRVLFWELPDHPDYLESCLYRGSEAGFALGEPLFCGATTFFLEPEIGHYWYVLRHRDSSGNWTEASNEVELQAWVSAAGTPAPAPRLTANPNPFNPWTRITLVLARPLRTDVAVYDLQGRRLRTLASGELEAGEHVFTWDGCDGGGRGVGSGVYLVGVGGDISQTRIKITLLK